jgi:hypothetical protein
MRITPSPLLSRQVCTTKSTAPVPTAPSVIHRSSSSDDWSRWVKAWGSSKTRAAVSKRTSCLCRFCRFLLSSHSKYKGAIRHDITLTKREIVRQYNCTYLPQGNSYQARLRARLRWQFPYRLQPSCAAIEKIPPCRAHWRHPRGDRSRPAPSGSIAGRSDVDTALLIDNPFCFSDSR